MLALSHARLEELPKHTEYSKLPPPKTQNFMCSRFQNPSCKNPVTHASTTAPTTIRYTANGANPCFLTHARNHATAPYATMNDTTNPISSTTHPCASMWVTPIAFSPLPRSDFNRSYPVAATIVGIERKNENSSADARDIPASCPAAIVDIEREVPGNSAERIWQAPIQIAWPRFISSMCQVLIRVPVAPSPAPSDSELTSSTIHITSPPSSTPAKIPSTPPQFPAAQTAGSHSNHFSWMLRRFSCARQNFPHFVRVDFLQIVTFQRRFDTITMPVPERNARFIVDCRFQQNRSHAPQCQVLFAFRQQRRSHSLPPMRLRHVQRNHVRQRRIFIRQNKSHDPPGVLRHQSVRRRQLQKISQHRL